MQPATTSPFGIAPARPVALPRFAGLLRNRVLARLESLDQGRLRLLENGREHLTGQGADCATLEVHDPRFWSAVALGGGTGAADAYAAGLWSSPDLVALVRTMVRNRHVLQGLDGGAARLAGWLGRLAHTRQANTLSGSRRNIAAHYDLGNDFYKLFLDETLSYSSALWAWPEQSLAQAQTEKIDRLCRDLALSPDHHLLEIGTGWGSLAIHAARLHGCRVTTTTLSAEQRTLAQERIRKAGLEHRIEVLLCDYRDLEGSYDRVVSVEMIEAVGHDFIGRFVEACSRLLKPDGLLALQAITYPDRHYDAYRRRADFIQRRIFPGSCLVSLAHLHRQVSLRSDLRFVAQRDITEHYARTLAEWRQALHTHHARALALGYTKEFLRMWDYYLAYCEGGFREHFIGDVQLLLAKPQARPSLAGNWA